MNSMAMAARVAATLLLLTSPALAQDDEDENGAAASLAELEAQFQAFEEAADRAAAESAKRIDVRALAGVQAYTGQAAGLVSPGASYGVAIGYDTSPLTEIELSYQGAAFATQSGAVERHRIMENGGQAIVKIVPRLPRLEPYAFGGVALSRLDVLGGDGGPVRDDTLVKLPVGLGLDLRVYAGDAADVLLGARGTWGFVLDDEAFQTSSALTNEGRLTIHLGAAF